MTQKCAVQFLCTAFLTILTAATAFAETQPNIVYILADDLGYGDVRCFNPESKIATPNLDRLAAEGMLFSDMHSGSAVCTPTRYGLLTGRYAWRSRLKKGVLGGYSRPLIEPGRLTVPRFLKEQGYQTACIGKWHLGLGLPLKEGQTAKDGGRTSDDYPDAWNVNYQERIENGPLKLGFDSFFGISASLDMPPFLFIDNDHFTEIPTTEKTWLRTGPSSAAFEAVDVLPTLIQKAVAYLDENAIASKSGEPFFLYLPLTAPHTPTVPSTAWQGKSGVNEFADFVMQTDAGIGAVLAALDRNSIAGDTLVIVTSDNGNSPLANHPELLAKGHRFSHHFRGHKADIFEGGHRIPFLARWPGRVKPGSRCDETFCLTDLFATCADILGVKLPANAAEDSVSLLPALEGRTTSPAREAVVHHSIDGSFAIRQGQWKLALCPDSGGWSEPKPGSREAQGLPAVQLYDLAADVGERHNVAAAHPDVVARFTKLLEKYVADGRSTPGPRQENTTPVEIHRRPPAAQPTGK